MEEQNVPITTYIAWGAGGLLLGNLKDTYIDPKFKSGEWEKPTIPLPFFGGGGGTDAASDAAAATADAVSTAVNAATDAASSSL